MRRNIYDLNYYLNLLKKYAGSAELITTLRWNLIQGFPNIRTVLDYGCGCNFMSAFAPANIEIDSYDVGYDRGNNEYFSYPQTGIRKERYDAICLFDVIEHVDWKDNPDSLMIEMIKKSTYVFITVPIFEPKENNKIGHNTGFYDPPTNMVGWKHYRPGEHLTYFTKQSLEQLLSGYGYELLYSDRRECPPREDVHSFVFKTMRVLYGG